MQGCKPFYVSGELIMMCQKDFLWRAENTSFWQAGSQPGVLRHIASCSLGEDFVETVDDRMRACLRSSSGA